MHSYCHKKQLADSNVYAIDISIPALNVARQNAIDQKVKIEFTVIDFLNQSSWESLLDFDIIISNPPYIPEEEKTKLDKNVSDHEPNIALFVPVIDPFIFYKKIALFVEEHLKTDGKIFVEVHEDYSNKVSEIFSEHNLKTKIKKDMYGRDRMIKAFR